MDYGVGAVGGFGGNSLSATDGAAELLSSTTTMTLAVSDSLVGSILGPKGATMQEIMNLSDGKITVSPRGEFVEGTTNRLVTITGTPSAAQTACRIVQQLIQRAAAEL